MTHEQNRITDKLKRLMRAIFAQMPWLAVVLGGVWYVRAHVSSYVAGYFDIDGMHKLASGLEMRLGVLREGLSVMSPLKMGDYLAVFGNLSLTQAKMATAQKTADLIVATTTGFTTVVVWIALFYAVIRVFRCYREQNQNNEIANLVVAKLLPYLQNKK